MCLELQNLGSHQKKSLWTGSYDKCINTIDQVVYSHIQEYKLNKPHIYISGGTYRERNRVRRPIEEGIAPFNKLLDTSLYSVFRCHKLLLIMHIIL